MAKQNKKIEGTGKIFDFGLGNLFKGLSNLAEKLETLSEKGGEILREGEFKVPEGGQGLKGVYGFRVKFGLGGDGLKVEPFGNIREDEHSGRAVVHEVREPMVDVFDENEHVLVLAEMPGVGKEDLKIDLEEDILTMSAAHGDIKYRKEVLLPGKFRKEDMQVSANNGVVEIRLKK